VEDVEEKATLGEVPDKRGDEGARQGGTGGDAAPGGELVGDIKEQPDDQVGKNVIDMQRSRHAHQLEGALDIAGEPEGASQHQRQEEYQEKVGPQSPENAALRRLENIVDDEIVILEEHHRREEHIADTDIPQLVGIGDESIDMAHNGGGVGRDKILLDEIVQLTVGGLKERHMRKEHQQDYHERDDEEEGAPAHAGGVEAETIVE